MHTRVALLVALVTVRLCTALKFDPCSEAPLTKKGDEFVIGLAFWPGAVEADWGSTNSSTNSSDTNSSSIHPCNATTQQDLAARGMYFGTYNAKADHLTVLKTTYPETLYLTSKAAADTPKVISVVAFRGSVRSEPRYVVSLEPKITFGQGFVSSLSLIAKFKGGQLEYLQWYNLTCNDCGGKSNPSCINGTSCALPDSNCTCASGGTTTTESPSTALEPPPPPPDATAASPDASTGSRRLQETSSTCSYAGFTYCATSMNLAFEGVDMDSSAFTTASQIKRLNSYSLVSLYYKGLNSFFNVKSLFTGQAASSWGQFANLQESVTDAYSGNAQAGRTTGGSF